MVIEELEAGFVFPPGVTLLDGGTAGLNLMPLMMGYDVIIVTDTVKAKGSAGQMRLYRKADLARAARSPLVGVIPESVAAGNRDEYGAQSPCSGRCTSDQHGIGALRTSAAAEGSNGRGEPLVAPHVLATERASSH